MKSDIVDLSSCSTWLSQIMRPERDIMILWDFGELLSACGRPPVPMLPNV